MTFVVAQDSPPKASMHFPSDSNFLIVTDLPGLVYVNKLSQQKLLAALLAVFRLARAYSLAGPESALLLTSRNQRFVRGKAAIMAQASISSDKWVLDADLEGQKEEQNVRVGSKSFETNASMQ